MPEYDNEMRGVLFKNEDKKHENSPDYTGSCEVRGEEFRLGAWIKKAKSGKKYMSLAFTSVDGDPPRQKAQDFDDDIPF